MSVVEESVDALGVDERLVARATSLRQLLRDNGAVTEERGELPEENLHAIDAEQLFDLTKPKVRGGLQTNVRTTVEAIAEVARGCPSTAWVMAVYNVENISVAFLPQEAQQRIYDYGRGTRTSGTWAPTAKVERLDGGFRVSGAWNYASGSHHADWIFAGVNVPTADGSALEHGQMLLPLAGAVIEHSWDVTGLSGTGSDTVRVEEVFVPEEMFMPTARLASGAVQSPYQGALYRIDWSPTQPLIQGAPLLGMARGALDLTLAGIGEKPLALTSYVHTRDAPPTYTAVARAASMIDTAWLHMSRAADLVDRAAVEGRRLSPDERARSRMDVAAYNQNCHDAVELLMDANGSSAFRRQNPIQRYWRDLAIASRHVFLMASHGPEFYGRHLMGAAQTAELL